MSEFAWFSTYIILLFCLTEPGKLTKAEYRYFPTVNQSQKVFIFFLFGVCTICYPLQVCCTKVIIKMMYLASAAGGKLCHMQIYFQKTVVIDDLLKKN